MKSFAILRTNVGLTTNVKIMVDSQYNLSLDSIDSIPELKNSKYKKLSFNKNNYYDELVPYLWRDLPAETAYSIKYDNDNNTMTTDFSNQYDEIYQYGARNIIDNKNYLEEFEYFAPLYLIKDKLPSGFIIFRVDGPGLLDLDRFNFKREIVNKLKTVKLFDFSKKTNLGEWLNNNFVDNEFFPETPFDMSFDRLEFSEWNGIDYKTGGYTSKSLFLDDFLEKENEIFEFEKFVFDNYKQTGTIFPNILNFSFLFDDTPATGDLLRKWSINRYYGFYLDGMDLMKTVSPYSTPKLKGGVKITSGNILESSDQLSPFVDGWDSNKDYYVEYLGKYYKVEKFTQDIRYSLFSSRVRIPLSFRFVPKLGGRGSGLFGRPVQSISVSRNLFYDEIITPIVDKWRIISTMDLTGKESSLNKNTAIVDSNKRLVDYDGNKVEIEDFDLADVWIIDIDGVYHNIIKEDGYLKLNTDYEFSFKENTYTYWINISDPSYTRSVSFILNKGETPKKFNIYRLNFTDIKDFDDKVVDTEYSKFEYEEKEQITNTDETKMYFVNLNENPVGPEEFVYKNETENIPVSSEYTANHETFKIENNDLTPLWRKNPIYCRWVYNNSLSANDYPYLLNNSKLFERFNRTTNTYDSELIRGERSLDYFYTVNSSTFSYLHHTLHVENNNDGGIDLNFFFDFDKYLGKDTYITGTNSVNLYNLDYFTWFFERKTSFLNNTLKRNVTKYSLFNPGSLDYPNSTLFRGIKFSIYDVENIRKNNDGNIDVINTRNSNTYDDYKFSILLTSDENGMDWNIIENWEMEKVYVTGSIVVYDDILYKSLGYNQINAPSYTYNWRSISGNSAGVLNIKSSPYSSLITDSGIKPSNILNTKKRDQYWTYYTDHKSPFWNPYRSVLTQPDPDVNGISKYSENDIVYNSDEWYHYNPTFSSVDFWNPYKSLSFGGTGSHPNDFRGNEQTPTGVLSGYNKGNIVIYKGDYYESLIDFNFQKPDFNQEFRVYSDEYFEYEINNDFINYVPRSGFTWTTNWKKIDSLPSGVNPRWLKITIWNPGSTYNYNTYVVHDDIVFIGTSSNPENNFIKNGEEPGNSTYWSRVYSVEPDTNYVYSTASNPFIIMNSEIYKINSNPNNKTLENGIRIYINKKWKNVLVNIVVNDNTLSNLENTDRDDIYKSIYSKLSAKNFIDSINNLTNKYEFTDYVKYIVIDEDLSIKEYDYNNIESLPIIIFADKPRALNFKVDSLLKYPINVEKLKSKKNLNNGFIDNLYNLNYYNETHVATTIVDNLNEPPVMSFLHGIRNKVQNSVYKFSGNYMPLFYELELFKKDNSTKYNEIQFVFYTEINDEFTFTFEKDGVIVEKNYNVTAASYYNDIMNILYNQSLFSGAGFIFEILKKDDKYINDSTNQNYDVLSIKYKQSFGNLKVSAKQTVPTLLFDISNSPSDSNLTFVLSATAGHPPYQYAFGYISGTYSSPLSSFTTTVTYTANKTFAQNNNDTKMYFQIYTKDSYGITSSKSTYTLNSNTEKTIVDSGFYYEFL
jgi:hypothetical protein